MDFPASSFEELPKLLKLHSDTFVPPVPFDFRSGMFAHLDLSVDNAEFAKIDVFDNPALAAFIARELELQGATIGIGGYDERRGWYSRTKAYILDGEPREYHIGLDIWVPEGTPVRAPLSGRVHSFKNNSAFADYGPTIILEHSLEGTSFYVLYGHLTVESLATAEKGRLIRKGEEFAKVGDSAVNGNWPPHLHLQVIQDMRGMEGDFYGVVNRSRREEFLALCPDPSPLLNLPSR